MRRPLDLWFGSAFAILAHLCAAEAIWLDRLRDRQTPLRLLTAADFGSTADLIETWQRLDTDWEAYVAALTSAQLDEEIIWQRQEGQRYSCRLWQPLLHVPFHSSEHRGHATVALTQIGVQHGPQDFLYQFLPPPPPR